MPTIFHRRPLAVDAPLPNAKSKGKGKARVSSTTTFGLRRSSAPSAQSSRSPKKERRSLHPKAALLQQEDKNTGQHIFCSSTSSTDGFVHLRVSLRADPAPTSFLPPPPSLTAHVPDEHEIIPTLASAIHLDSSSSSSLAGHVPNGAAPMFPSSTFGLASTKPLLQSTNRVPSPLDIPPCASSISDHSVTTSHSRSSIAIVASDAPARPASRASLRRRASIKALGLRRKLSIDGLLNHVVRKRSSQILSGNTRESRDSSGGGRKLDIRRWSSTALPPTSHSHSAAAHSTADQSVVPVPAVTTTDSKESHRHSRALPSIRTLRTKFSSKPSASSPARAVLAPEDTKGGGRRTSIIGIGFPPLSRLSPRLMSKAGRRPRMSIGDIYSPTGQSRGEAEEVGKLPVGMAGILHKLEAETTAKRGDENLGRRSSLDRQRSLVAPSVAAAHHRAFVPRLIPFDTPPEESISASTSLAAHARTPQQLTTPSNGHLSIGPTPVDPRFASPARDDTSPLDPMRSPLPAIDSTLLAPSETTRYPLTASNSTLTASCSSASGASGPDGQSRQSLAELRVAVRQMRDLRAGNSVTSDLDTRSDKATRSSHASTLAKLSSCHTGSRNLASDAALSCDPSTSSIGGLSAGTRHSIDGLPLSQKNRHTPPASHPLKPSRSKSTTALPALLSAFDLVETTQRTQGNGWWSRHIPSRPAPPVPHPSRITPKISPAVDGHRAAQALEEKLAALEKLVQSCSYSRNPRSHATPPPSGSFRSYMTPPPARRRLPPPTSSMEERTPWRAGSGLPRSRSRSYVAPMPHPIYDSPRKSHLRSEFSKTTPETPCRASKLPCGRPNPAPRRVSWLVEDQPISPRAIRPGTPKSRLVSPAIGAESESTPHISQGWQDRVEELRAKHALETDALLFALSGAKVGEDRLRKEVEGLHRLLAEGLAEREVLRGRVNKLENRLGRGDAGASASEGRHVDGKKKSVGLAIKGAEELLGPQISA